jgi:hypothetical protein
MFLYVPVGTKQTLAALARWALELPFVTLNRKGPTSTQVVKMKSRIAMIATKVLTAYTYEKQSRHEHPIPLFDEQGTRQVPLFRLYITDAIWGKTLSSFTDMCPGTHYYNTLGIG